MKHLFTGLAIMATAMSANALDFTCVANPAAGEVPELSSIELMFPEIFEIEGRSKDDINMTFNGQKIDGVSVKIPYGKNLVNIVIPERLVEPGEYVLNIPDGSLTGYNADYSEQEPNPAISFKYTIAGTGKQFSYTVDPEEGVQTELTTVTFAFPEFDEVEIPTADDLYATFNGVKIAGVKAANKPYGSNKVVFTISETKTAPGTYEFVIPAGGLFGYCTDPETGDYYEPSILQKEITATYTIEGTGNELDFSYTASPSPENILSSLETVKLTFDALDSVEALQGSFIVSVGGIGLSYREYDVESAGNTVTVTLPMEVEDAVVGIEIPAGALTGTLGTTTATNPEAISLEYTMASATVYDLTAVISTPAPNAAGEISADRSLESIFFSSPVKGLVVSGAGERNVTIKEVNGDFEASAVLKKANGINSNYSYFSAAFGREPVYNGKYVITIDKGAFGDAVWGMDHEFGHSNDRIELTFTLVDGNDRELYLLVPTVTPAEGTYTSVDDIKTITVEFEDTSIEMVEDAFVSIGGIDNDYLENAYFSKTAPGKFQATFTGLPTIDARWMMTINAGQFGDAAFISSDGAGGSGSREVVMEYVIRGNDAVSEIAADLENAEIYNLQGIRVSNIENLPAGLYIIGGRKVMIGR